MHETLQQKAICMQGLGLAMIGRPEAKGEGQQEELH